MSDSMEVDNRTVTLKSKDEKAFSLPAQAATISDLVKDSIEGHDGDEDEAIEVNILRVSSDCLEKVVEFMKHHQEEPMKEIPTPLGGSSFAEVRSSAPTPKLSLASPVRCASECTYHSSPILHLTLIYMKLKTDHGPKVVPRLCSGR